MSGEQTVLQSDADAGQPLLKPSSWLAQLDFINHLLLFNNIMLVAFAENQGGKTSYTSFLVEHLADTFDIFATQIPTAYEEKAIATELASHLNLVKPEQASIKDICKQVNERNHHTLLILDNAHRLPQPQIKDLLNIVKSQSQTPFFHLILVADYSLLPYLKQLSSNDKDDAIHSLEIGTFAKDEVKTFLHQKITDERLKQLINNANSNRFYQSTKGEIGTMNHEMSSFFNSLAKNNRKIFKRLKNLTAISAVVLIGFVSMQLLFNPDNFYQLWLSSWHRNHKVVKKNIKHPSEAKQTAQVEDPNFPLPSLLSKITLPVKKPYVDSDLPSIDNSLFHVAARSQKSLNNATSKQAMSQKVGSKIHNKGDKTTVKSHQTKFKVEARVAQRANHSDEAKTIDSKLVSIQFGSAKPQKPNIPPKYTIQLVATHQLKFLNALIKKHPVTALKVYTYPIQQNGEQWYILTAGRFTNWSAAHDALANLPKEYQQFQPWIRPINKG